MPRTIATFAAVAAAASIAVVAAGMPRTAQAEIGILDNVPAATLLVPWFEVELDGGRTTLLSINNASDDIVPAHVTLWSEWWVPIIGFDVYLTGYDVQTINLADIILNGDLPNTGPSNVLSAIGAFSGGPHSTFGGTCSTTPGSSPNYALLSAFFLQVIQQSLSGQPRASDSLCTAEPGNTNLARGYVTVDVVRRCSQEFSDNVNYFVDGGLGTATNQNVLWGDYFLADPANDFAQGFTMVHIEADGVSLGVDDGSCDTVDRHPTTFYCTLRNPTNEPGEDNREGLPSVYLTRYVDGGAFTGGTALLAWRDKNGTGAGTARSCNTTPTPLQQTQLVVFDEQENPLLQGGGPAGEPVIPDHPFPWGANLAEVGTDITIDSSFGWMFINLNDGNPASNYFRQAVVSTVFRASGRFSVGFEAIAVNSLTLGADNRRGPRNSDPTLGQVPNPDTPTLFDGTVGP